jgi:monoamine oxidase
MARTPLLRTLILALQTARRENLKVQQLSPPISASEANWSRRKFLKTTSLAGMLGLTGGLSSLPALATSLPVPKIAIIGAGLAGLNAAYQLKKVGMLTTVYEARSRVGGRVRSAVMKGGLIVDLGAELINTDHADMLDLVADFGIKLFDRLADSANQPYPKSAFYFDGARINESELADDLRMMADQINADSVLLDQDWDTYAPLLDKLSVTDYLDLHADKISKSYIRELLISIIRTEYGVESDESSALQLIFVLPVVNGQAVDLLSYSDEAFSVVGGSAEITTALGAELAGQVQLNKSLTEITANDSGYLLKFSDQSTVETDIVIITIPFPVLSRITLNVTLPRRLRHFINEGKLGSNEKVIGSFSTRIWRTAQAFSSDAWGIPGFSEVWDETARQDKRHDGALNFFLGGDEARQLGAIKDVKTLGAQFVSALNDVIPGALQAAKGQFIKSGWTVNPKTLGGYSSFKPGQLTRFGGYFWIESDIPKEQQDVSVGNLIFAGEHLSDEFYGFMNGAAQTGRLAANLVVKKIAALTI